MKMRSNVVKRSLQSFSYIPSIVLQDIIWLKLSFSFLAEEFSQKKMVETMTMKYDHLVVQTTRI